MKSASRWSQSRRSKDEIGVSRIARALVPVGEEQPLVGGEVKFHPLALDAHVAIAVLREAQDLARGGGSGEDVCVCVAQLGWGREENDAIST